jgi:hypothetical protein
MCLAGAYERRGDGLRVNPPNCFDCKATDVSGPHWTPREGTSGPHYRRMQKRLIGTRSTLTRRGDEFTI